MADTPSSSQATREIGSGDQGAFLGFNILGVGGRDPGAGIVDPTSPFVGGLGFQGLLRLSLMAATDETVGPMLWLIESALGSSVWKHTPQVDGSDDTSNDKAVKAAAFADTLLLDMKHTWAEHLVEALTMVPLGFATCEINLRPRLPSQGSRFSDGLWGIKSLPLRDQMSITGWTWDGSDLATMKQLGIGGQAEIPMWKVLHYRTRALLNNPYGRSMLTNAYTPWQLKRRIQDSEATGIDRDLAGIPMFRLPQSVIDDSMERNQDGSMTPAATKANAMIQSAIKAVRDMRMRRNDGLILPSDTYASDDPESKDRTPMFDFKLMTTAGPRTIDTRNAVRDYDMAIARVLLMQFIQLGTKGGGSYGLSSDQSEVAYASLMALANMIAAEFSRKALPLVWELNGMNKKYLPQLRPDQVNKEGLQSIGAFLNGIGRSVLLWQDDPDARMNILDRAGLTGSRAAQQKAVDALAQARTDASAAASLIGHNGGPALPSAE